MSRLLLWIQGVLVPTLGPTGLFIVAFLDSSFLSLPEINDLLVVTSVIAAPERAWLPILMATLGSLAGCSVLWVLGRWGGEPLLERQFGVERVGRTRVAFERWDMWALAIPAVLPPPMPFKVFVLSAGVFGFSYRRFALTLLIARGVRYLFWGAMGAEYGDEALEMLRSVDSWTMQEAPLLAALAAATILALLLVFYLRRRGRPAPDVGGVR